MVWNLACLDWEDRIRSGRSLVPELPLHQERAKQAVAVFDRLRLADVPGNPTLREAAGDWFRDIVRALHGSWDQEAGERYIREIFALVSKKNAKTSYGAGLMLTSLILNKRPKGKFLLVAPTQDVTELAFGQAQGMIELDKYLSGRMKVQTHLKKITDTSTGATLEVMSFDPNVLTGQKPVGFLVDELHVVSQSAKASSAIGQLRGGMIAQPEAFGLFITTQSEKPPAGVFKAELTMARAIRDGRATGRTLPVLYEFPADIANSQTEWKNPRHWPMVTPNRGRSITVDRLIEEFAGAEQRGDEEVRRWASQHLNVQVGLSLHSDRWAGAEYWEDQADAALTLDALLDRSEVVVVGIDGGGLDDLLGLAVLGRDKATRDWLHWGHAWAHPAVLKRRLSEAPRLRDLAAAGDLTLAASVGEDVEQVADLVARIDARGLLHSVGLDPMGVGAIVDAMAERGIQGDKRIVGISQGWQLTNCIKTAERKLADGTLHHCGQALMAWAVGNAKVEPRGNAIIITKQTAGSAKIDPLLALLNSVALMSRNPEAMNGPSMYEETGIRMLG